ncbi:MAG: hypothetical protein IKU91_02720, partial [Anaerotignum sp.]|nr:hypothetical protein [Anaerotignum sp.]
MGKNTPITNYTHQDINVAGYRYDTLLNDLKAKLEDDDILKNFVQFYKEQKKISFGDFMYGVI